MAERLENWTCNSPVLSSYDGWIKEVKTHFLKALPLSEVNIFTNSNEEVLFIICPLCIPPL